MVSARKMQDSVAKYLADVSRQYQSGHAVEMAYRPALKELMESFTDVLAVNDPKHSEHGAPDFIFLRVSNPAITRGYAEAKDVGTPLDRVEKSEQMRRYAGYANLYLTDYLEFRFYKNGEKYETISIGQVDKGVLTLFPENAERLARELYAFLTLPPEEIRSGRRLAEIMGGKARRIRDNVAEYIADEAFGAEDLRKIYRMMREMLVHDLSPAKFADMYAQTLVYGLFVARYDDKTPESFTRSEARDLVPRSNPFLREFFDHIAGTGFDPRLAKIVEELCDVFSVSNVSAIVHTHLRTQDATKDPKDPIIHFYEDFLSAYDPEVRRSMGAYYTPTPVVKYIVRSVDRILKEDFGITRGLASTDRTSYEVATQPWRKKGERKSRTTKEVTGHRVQILDPAVGTATFLNETIKFIHQSFAGQEGRWPAYVRDNLVPRIFGFELMMAPYTIAHMKLSMTLKETGVEDLAGRLNIFLTNTLEVGVPTQPDLFSFGLAEAVSEESRRAAEIKSERPVMIVLGNPPYSGVSSNETAYANGLVGKYKVEPGGQQKLQERKHWLNDDYVKFLAFAEDMIAKNGSGIVAMITNNGYMSNPTFRGMRWRLARTFDKIYVLDLHGNANKKETTPDGGKDENVFDIMQGVGIILAIKSADAAGSGQLAEVFHSEVYGLRQEKFDALTDDAFTWSPVPLGDGVYFIPRDLTGHESYGQGVALPDLFLKDVTGIVTMGDDFIISQDQDAITSRVKQLADGTYDAGRLAAAFKLGKNYAKFILGHSQALEFDDSRVVPVNFRPFDARWTYFDNKVLWRWREDVMKHFFRHQNVGLVTTRFQKDHPGAFVTEHMITHKVFNSYDSNSVFPLYLYHQDGTRTSNFEPRRFKELTANLSAVPVPEDVFDYIYAVLHSPSYRETNAVFLKENFPRIPVVASDAEFARLVPLGRQLREVHLLKAGVLDDLSTTYSVPGDNSVERVAFQNGRVYINEAQYFGEIPESAWSFYVGGYQPAQKWLADRKGQTLSDDDLDRYQRIVMALAETGRIMQLIG